MPSRREPGHVRRIVLRSAFGLAALAWLASAATPGGAAQFSPQIPRFWSEELLHQYELPLATPERTPRHVPAAYYEALPERTLYRSYPVYHPDREPAGYFEKLASTEPKVIFDARTLKTESDWIAAGQLVFEMPIDFNGPLVEPKDVRDRTWYTRHAVPLARDGTLPGLRWVVRRRGEVALGNLACAMCHTRVMPDGAVIAGAQGNFPFDGVFAASLDGAPAPAVRGLLDVLVGVPWDRETTARLEAMSPADLQRAFASVPPGVIVRQGTNLFAPPAIPDLIGIADRRYLDKTGLGRHTSPADLMRYAAMNQALDVLGDYGGFIPTAADRRTLPPPGKGRFSGSDSRYSDAQLYALAMYLYSLAPPANPNPFDDRARRGQQVFEKSGCATCHTPPLYTNNRLTPADGFTVPPEHLTRYDVLNVRVGTDPTLTMKSRRGTGYYKVPSLRGVWYRGPFEHNGSVASLEDWFDPRRLRDDYTPTGYRRFGAASGAVKGHPFGLNLSAGDRASLVAFLKTL